VLEWIQANLVGLPTPPALSLAEIYYREVSSGKADGSRDALWNGITPRIAMFKRLFHELKARHSPSQFVEAMYQSGIDGKVLESLPEAVLIPLRDIIAACQPMPPMTWSDELLELVDRTDVSLILTEGKHSLLSVSNILVSLCPIIRMLD
jgi:anaphase-promoting complex subunit 1